MDRRDLESCDRVHEDQRRVRPLLCRALLGALARRPRPPLRDRFRSDAAAARLQQPLLWRQPRMIFVNSMSDLFHKEIPAPFIEAVFDTMEKADWHTFQVLTKRSSLMRNFLRRRYGDGRGPAHMWFGVSVEDGTKLSRVRHLQQAPAGVRFLSIEPLIAPLGTLDLIGIHWIIVGGESGPGARPMDTQWVRDIRDQCARAGVAFFFKQWGGLRPKFGGRTLDGREWSEFPAVPQKPFRIAAE